MRKEILETNKLTWDNLRVYSNNNFKKADHEIWGDSRSFLQPAVHILLYIYMYINKEF